MRWSFATIRWGWMVAVAVAVLAAVPSAGGEGRAAELDPAKNVHQYVLDVWGAEEGVPPHPIQDLLRSREGYLWLATRGGLGRFNGVSLTFFDLRNTPELIFEDMSSLAEDRDGRLWIGTLGGGLVSYQGGRFVARRTGSALGDVVESLVVDGEGVLWVGTRGGLFQLAGGTLRPAPVPEALAGAPVRALRIGAGGDLWLGTRGRGLFRRHGGAFTALAISEALRGATLSSVLPGEGDSLWVGTEDFGLHRWDGSTWDRLDLVPGPGPESIYDLYAGLAGQVWIATNDGLFRWRPGGSVEVLSGGKDPRIRSMTSDHEGNFWIGTYQGLQRLKDAFITPYGAPEGFVEEHARAVYEDSRGRLWIGTLGGGLHVIDGASTRVVSTREGLPSDRVWSILRAQDGTHWLGTDDGLVRALGPGDPLDRLRSAVLVEPTEHPLRVVYEDLAEPGTLWLGTIGGGLWRWRGRIEARFGADEGLLDGDIRWILQASPAPGDLWIGTQLGLHRLRDGRLEAYTTADGLASPFIVAAHLDAAGDLWLGTFGGGLARFADGRFTVYTSRDGLPANDVWCILEAAGDLWLSNDQGVHRVAKTALSAYDQGRIASLPVASYGRADGMRSVELNGGGFPCGWVGRSSRLWFPSFAGVIRIDPEARRALDPPPVAIESFWVDRLEVPLDGPIRLPPVRGDLEITFTGLSLRDPQRLRFQYRLLDYDPDWIDAGARRRAFYTQIPPGTYRFEVVALVDGVRSVAPAELRFTIAPHIYQTWWFSALCLSGAAGLVYGGFRLRTRRIRAHNLRLRREIEQRQEAESALATAVGRLEERNEELRAKNEEMERFLYTVSHDLKSPLVTIKGFLGLLRQDAASQNTEGLERDVATIGEAVDDMQQLLGELLELSRVARMVNPSEDVPMVELAREVVGRLRGVLDEAGVEVRIQSNLPVVFADRRRLSQVLQNLIDNAVRYMGDQAAPRIEIGYGRRGEEPVFFVRDNGMGIEPRYHRKIFGLFERLETSGEGTGIGLALVARIVELHGGRVWVESPGRGAGSTFCWTLAGLGRSTEERRERGGGGKAQDVPWIRTST